MNIQKHIENNFLKYAIVFSIAIVGLSAFSKALAFSICAGLFWAQLTFSNKKS